MLYPHLENAGENHAQILTWIAGLFDAAGDFIIGKENGFELASKEDTAMSKHTRLAVSDFRSRRELALVGISCGGIRCLTEKTP